MCYDGVFRSTPYTPSVIAKEKVRRDSVVVFEYVLLLAGPRLPVSAKLKSASYPLPAILFYFILFFYRNVIVMANHGQKQADQPYVQGVPSSHIQQFHLNLFRVHF